MKTRHLLLVITAFFGAPVFAETVQFDSPDGKLKLTFEVAADGGVTHALADVKAFLEYLAVELRVSSSTQKQALNALVFFIQEGLGIHLGELSFRRAAKGASIPMALSREEVKRLFAQLDGTSRLMAA